MKDYNPPKRLKRKELIAQTERRRLTNRFKKEMKKEKGNPDIKGRQQAAKTSSTQEEGTKNNYMTANKKAMLEYEAKMKEKQAKLEVG